MLSATATPAPKPRTSRPTRSNSTSSSVVTVKKAPSHASRSGSRTPLSKARSPSPEPQFGFQLTAIVTTNPARNSASRSRPSSGADTRLSAGNLNINRWSHSTTSSTSGIDLDPSWKRRSSSARRMSLGPTHSTGLPAPAVKSQPSPQQHRRSKSRDWARLPRAGEGPPPGELPPNPPVLSLPVRGMQHDPSHATASMNRVPSMDYVGGSGRNRSGESPTVGHPPAQPMSMLRPHPGPQPSARAKAGLPHVALQDLRAPMHLASDQPPRSSHSRHRASPTQGSADTAAGSSMSSTRSEASRRRGHRSPTQKTMLSKALAKANTAVVLDNAQNFPGAVEAYAEACDLLHQVMLRSSDADDRNKLAAIHTTYSNRVAELREQEDPFPSYAIDKELPEPPDPGHNYYDEDELVLPPVLDARSADEANIPPRRQSLMPTAFMSETQFAAAMKSKETLVATTEVPTRRHPPLVTGLTVPIPRDDDDMPPPLSPRKPVSPPEPDDAHQRDEPERQAEEEDEEEEVDPSPVPAVQHTRDVSTESTSWLDTIDESTSSTSSRLSSMDFRPSIGSNLVHEIEAQFDAALRAAVDAAYQEPGRPESMNVLGSPRMATESRPESPRARQAESASRDGEETAEGEVARLTRTDVAPAYYDEDDDAAEEERILDEMTRGYSFGDFYFDKQSKSALPRQSDSSGFSGRTWGSSTGSTNITNGTSLSTLAETLEDAHLPKLPPPRPVPTGALPLPPPPTDEPARPPAPVAVEANPSTFERPIAPGVRDRRFSGQNAKQLKIETNSRKNSVGSVPAAPKAATALDEPIQEQPTPVDHTAHVHALTGPASTSTLVTAPLTPLTSVHSGDSFLSGSPATTALTQSLSRDGVDEAALVPPSPGRVMSRTMPPPMIRQNRSASNLRMRNLSAVAAETIDSSPITPGSATFGGDARKGAVTSAVPTPSSSHFPPMAPAIGGMYLFDDRIGTPNTPRTPRTPGSINPTIPCPLEACPESFLLRPFWLMRCLYQTLAHPKGGYLTTKLFIPRDIWRVKNVKLKALDDKISQCDLLTAALLKLAQVDNLDADAVLEEMQALESVLDTARTTLQKKLGSDVGLSGTTSMFKGSPATDDPESMAPKSATAAKSLASSWRKLRSKSSSAQMNAAVSAPATKEPHKDGATMTMPSLPMTASTSPPSSRSYLSIRRNPSGINLANMGIHAGYMASLTRLFDAAQVLDQIARQVEDPGLKCSSQTHVGLELCVRGAAEFFAFYICRFVLGDVGVLLDKFVKRGGEWVLV